MLTKEENERLTQVGPGTPMGKLLRRYWHPLATAAELGQEPVLAVKLLGERLALYRFAEGPGPGGRGPADGPPPAPDSRPRTPTYGLVGERCAHRGCSLAYGIPEDDGLRCAYHGWLYNREGTCIEQPTESGVLPIRISAYPVQELGGLIWAYLGPAPAPVLPRWDLLVLDGIDREIGITHLPCSWLQPMENSMDPMHFEYLHNRFGRYVLGRQGKPLMPPMPRHVAIDFEVFEYGIYKRRLLEGQSEDEDDWRIGHPILFPNILTLTDLGRPSFQIRVPVDDANTLHYWYITTPHQPGSPPQDRIPVYEYAYQDDAGKLVFDTTKAQDMMAWITQGPISDRTTEHPVTSDRGVLLYRKLLLDNIEKVERGEDPLGVIRDPARNEPMIPIHREQTTGRIAGSGLDPLKRELTPAR